ncbi:hypothetical protein [Pseudomonas fluorescens]|uniref:hypothetical protein n=1 Tax=Pseudomonas fluorescens TaxID=294 RepID=UPI00123FFC29|nr:hypothetical protein [Pseudomonas fluorescens]
MLICIGLFLVHEPHAQGGCAFFEFIENPLFINILMKDKEPAWLRRLCGFFFIKKIVSEKNAQSRLFMRFSMPLKTTRIQYVCCRALRAA